MKKIRVNYSIEEDILKKLDEYIEKRKGFLIGRISKSAIVENALAKELISLNMELEQQKTRGKQDLSIAR